MKVLIVSIDKTLLPLFFIQKLQLMFMYKIKILHLNIVIYVDYNENLGKHPLVHTVIKILIVALYK